ncbi:KH domain-containing protein [Candidatus Marinamargulisbacteria bacterium SCGC AG-410-N11]|nr:KH domain-containing protein [Candidatus Marinamargulisbacteria bacterium SCGC AG-410-N11]
MKDLVEMIVKALVDDPSQVHINETVGESVMILEIVVAQTDMGKVIGKDGRIANALRTVVKAAAAKNDKKVTIEILSKDER